MTLPAKKRLYTDRCYYSSNLDDLLFNKITFLNHPISFGEKIDWHRAELNRGTRLWKLTLHNHEFLIEAAKAYRDTSDKKYLEYCIETLLDWQAQNPLGTKDYGKDNWNSYAISLRLVSWSKIMSLLHDDIPESCKETISRSYRMQAEFLYDNLEYDILGNHLIKNWKALSFSAIFLQDDIYYDLAKKLFDKYIREQFTENGMHEELSPMYQAIITEDFLEVYNLDSRWSHLAPLIKKQYFCITSLSDPEGYAFYNDSVNGNAVNPKELSQLFKSTFKGYENRPDNYRSFDGYHIFEDRHQKLIFDSGPLVFGSQPGHGHCDALSFEYSRNGKKIFTNAGVYEYNAGERREYSRSTAAHNTLQYSNSDQSEVYGSFRCARKSTVNQSSVKRHLSGLTVTAEVTGFNFRKPVTHSRTVSITTDVLEIKDNVTTQHADSEYSKIFLRLMPDFSYRKGEDVYSIVDTSGNTIGEVSCTMPCEVQQTVFYPEFGKEAKVDTLIINNVPVDTSVNTKIFWI
ncbi:MAG: alginate lyase family protein [Balneolales bacterium]